MVNEKNAFSRQLLMFPVECREGGTTYQGNLEIDVRKCFVQLGLELQSVVLFFFNFLELIDLHPGKSRHCYSSHNLTRFKTNNPHFLPQLDILVEDTLVSTFTRQVGQAPIMVQSELCNLHGLCPEELVKKKEDHNEMGGYFVINGNEKVVRFVWSPTVI